jgi:curved DNA-binding protein CbpA
MTSQGDPYRTLGVASGASLNEIKSAYRRLAKKYHPDTAGERALPRFLAIQAAYEGLVDGEGRLRPDGTKPARAAPGRAPASRDAWRARRSGSDGSARSRAAGGSGRAAGSDGAPGRGGAAGASGTAGPRSHARRGPRKATPGSTTYDEAAETPLDPEWDGGAWYGPSSGTYWTLNPREYADPRKHGPEYLERARRAAGGAAPGETFAGNAGGAENGAHADEAPGEGAPAADTRRTEGSDEVGR